MLSALINNCFWSFIKKTETMHQIKLNNKITVDNVLNGQEG